MHACAAGLLETIMRNFRFDALLHRDVMVLPKACCNASMHCSKYDNHLYKMAVSSWYGLSNKPTFNTCWINQVIERSFNMRTTTGNATSVNRQDLNVPS